MQKVNKSKHQTLDTSRPMVDATTDYMNLSTLTNRRTQYTDANARFLSSAQKVAREVYFWLLNNYGAREPLDQQPLEKVIEGIEAMRGVDERTVSRWLNQFIKAGIIKPPKGKTELEKIEEISKELKLRTLEQVFDGYENPTH